MRPTCAPHAPHMRPTCVPHAPHMRPTCAPHAPHMRPTCALHAPYMRLTCALHAPHMRPTCAPHARRRSRVHVRARGPICRSTPHPYPHDPLKNPRNKSFPHTRMRACPCAQSELPLNPAPAWLTDAKWGEVNTAAELAPAFDGLVESFTLAPSAWKAIYDSADPQVGRARRRPHACARRRPHACGGLTLAIEEERVAPKAYRSRTQLEGPHTRPHS
eukprot:359475-Chlamydomonas_euryale.AAC.2